MFGGKDIKGRDFLMNDSIERLKIDAPYLLLQRWQKVAVKKEEGIVNWTFAFSGVIEADSDLFWIIGGSDKNL